MSNIPSRERLAADPQALDRAEALLLAYPAISADDLGEVIQFLKSASPMDVGLLSANKDAWSAGEQVRRDHPVHFRTAKWVWALWILGALALTAIIVALWDSGLKG